jgi:hypothetical protein
VTAGGATAAAERAVAMLEEMSADLRSCAVVGAEGEVLASSGGADWSAAGELWRAVDELPGPRVTQVHVATETGEVFAARSEGSSAVALTRRHALESLMFCDLRWALREVEG